MDHEDIAGTDVLIDFDGDFTVREAAYMRCTNFDAEVSCDFGGQIWVGVAGKDHEVGNVGRHDDV